MALFATGLFADGLFADGLFAEDVAGPDLTPDQWDFGRVLNAALSATDLPSNVVTITGIDAQITLNFTGDASARWRKNAGAWTLVSTTDSTTVVLNDTIEVDLDASASYGVQTSVTMTELVSGVTGAFSVTTLQDPAAAADSGLIRGIQKPNENSLTVGINS